MASTKLMHTKDGKPFYKIIVTAKGGQQFTTRFYPSETWSAKTTEKKLSAAASAFEDKVKNGEIENRAMKKERELQEQRERAKLKTLQQYVDGVFMPKKELTLSETSRDSYKMYLDKHILPVLGDYLLTEITTAMIEKLLLDFAKQGYAHATLKKLYIILNGVFAMAYKDDSIVINPMLKIDSPKQSKDAQIETEKTEALTVEQLNHCLSYLKNEPLKWRAYITLCADTGARRGELCGLQWQDINWQEQTINIQRNLQYTVNKGIYTASPKNGKKRIVDIGLDTLQLLKELQREQMSKNILSMWIFTQEDTAEPMHPQSPTRYFKKFGKRYNIPNFHPHLLRHTSASIAITNGADVASVAARLGHSNPAVTLKMYTHANPESIRNVGQTVRNALKQGT